MLQAPWRCPVLPHLTCSVSGDLSSSAAERRIHGRLKAARGVCDQKMRNLAPDAADAAVAAAAAVTHAAAAAATAELAAGLAPACSAAADTAVRAASRALPAASADAFT